MAKKRVKRVRKKSSKRVVRKRNVKRASKTRMVRSSKRKVGLALKNLILFGVLSVISYLLYNASGSEFYRNLFFLLAIILVCVAVAFLIVFLAFVFMKAMKK